MQSSAYNNPMFAQGLGGLVQSFIGNPAATGQAEESASRALLNNQTAQFRDAIGDTGMSGDLASMMVRALQAGPEYSGNAPKIGNAAVQMGAMGFGSPELTPDSRIASLIMQGMSGGGGRRSGGSGGSGGSGAAPAKLTQAAQNRVARMVKDSGYEGVDAAQITAAILEKYQGGGSPTLDQAASDILPGVNFQDFEVDDPNNPAGTALSRLFKDPGGFDTMTERRLVIPGVEGIGGGAAPSSEQTNILNQAREAISRGADQAKVIERLSGLGVDTSQL
jgi:hypothetical protein